MKKILAILLSGALAFASCSLPETIYKLNNVGDYMNFKEGILANDFGTEFTVKEDLSDAKWQVEGNRFYAVFDVLNINYDITLKSYINATVKAPAGEITEDQTPASDPVQISDCSISGGFLNVIFTYYYKPGTECPHNTDLYYLDNAADGSLTLRLVHEGGGENLVNMEEDILKSTSTFLCFPLTGLVPAGEMRSVFLECELLIQEKAGEYTSEHKKAPLYTQQIQF